MAAAAAILVIAAAVAAFAIWNRDDGGAATSGETIEIVVPAGTQERLDRGEEVIVMPSPLELRVGDRLLIRNEDTVDQSVGPFIVKAGREFSFTYGAAGTFQGYCPVSEGEQYEIIVRE